MECTYVPAEQHLAKLLNSGYLIGKDEHLGFVCGHLGQILNQPLYLVIGFRENMNSLDNLLVRKSATTIVCRLAYRDSYWVLVEDVSGKLLNRWRESRRK